MTRPQCWRVEDSQPRNGPASQGTVPPAHSAAASRQAHLEPLPLHPVLKLAECALGGAQVQQLGVLIRLEQRLELGVGGALGDAQHLEDITGRNRPAVIACSSSGTAAGRLFGPMDVQDRR